MSKEQDSYMYGRFEDLEAKVNALEEQVKLIQNAEKYRPVDLYNMKYATHLPVDKVVDLKFHPDSEYPHNLS